jgi:hypothetical protein
MIDVQSNVILKTEDLSGTLAWYQRAGFEVRGTYPEDAPTWAEVTRDDLAVQFLAGETPWPGSPALTGCLYVHPADVRAVHDEIKDAIDCPWGVEEREWGARELTVQDPNGYFVTFSESR